MAVLACYGNFKPASVQIGNVAWRPNFLLMHVDIWNYMKKLLIMQLLCQLLQVQTSTSQNRKCSMKFTKKNLRVHSCSCWTFLKTWVQMKITLFPSLYLTGRANKMWFTSSKSEEEDVLIILRWRHRFWDKTK